MRTKTVSLLTAVLAGFTFTSAAQSADMPRKAPVIAAAAAPHNWSGFYVGVHGGAAWGTVESELPIGGFAFPISSHTINGFLGGAQVGANWQVNSWLVFGVEGQFSWSDISGSTPCLLLLKCTTDVNWLGSVAGRVGYTYDRTMLYAKVGVAWADSDYSATFGPFVSFTANDTRTGLMIGAGVEHAFLPNWSAKLEYNYMDFDTDTLGFTAKGSGGYGECSRLCSQERSRPIKVDVTQQIHLIKFGVNYRFGGGGPLVARY